MGIKQLVNLHLNQNVYVTGVKGSGKDVMQGNVIARIKRRYVSNLDYTHDARYIPLDMNVFDVGRNTCDNFINNNLVRYVYPYEDGVNVYISDAQNYFPSFADKYLSDHYGYFGTWASLQRHLGNSSLHLNTQGYMRVWKTLRDQCADAFIRCDKCFVIFGNQGKFAKIFERLTKRKYKFGGFVLASYYFYDKAESCENRIKPCRVQKPIIGNKESRLQVAMYKDNFYNTHGTVEKHWYFCINKSKHDTRCYKTILEKGAISNEK